MTDAAHDADAADNDGFHEIQLSGKHLVFLFMATTVVSVAIFLCGVLVGRNVRGEAVLAASTTPATSDAGLSARTDPAPSALVADAPAPVDGTGLTYKDRLDGDKAVAEKLEPRRAAEEAPAEAPRPTPAEVPEAVKNATPPSQPVAASSAPPPAAPVTGAARPGAWVVQVVALTDRAAAAAVVQRLGSKGYPAFLVAPQAGAPVQNYKVQVGRFDDRALAEQTAGRLKKEEQFQPWILR